MFDNLEECFLFTNDLDYEIEEYEQRQYARNRVRTYHAQGIYNQHLDSRSLYLSMPLYQSTTNCSFRSE